MDLQEDLERRITEIARRVVKPKASEGRKGERSCKVSGAGHVVGDGNTVIMMHGASGASGADGPLSDAHKAIIDKLVEELVFHESIKRGKPYRVSDVRRKFRKALDLGPGLKDADFERIERYLKGWLAKVAAAKTEPGRDEKWRSRRVARILSTCRRLGCRAKLDQILAVTYSAAVLVELTDSQLEEVFRVVSTWT